MTKIKQIKCGMVNCWLLRGDSGSVLVDTAVVRYRDTLAQQVRGQNLKLIFLTHGHADHTGNTAALQQALNVPVGMAQADVEYMTNQRPRPMHSHTWIGKMIQNGSERSLYKPPAFTVNATFADGDTLAEYGVDATVVGLPGHTPGSLGLRVDDMLIVGDAMFNILKPTAARIYENREEMECSLEKIRELGIKTILPGHGKAFSTDAFFNGNK